MTKQVYSIIREDEKINIYKNAKVIYSILVADKSINLMELYNNMNIDIEDDIVLEHPFEKIDEPTDDADRIYNNTIDFMDRLLKSIDSKLNMLRETRTDSIFN